MSDQPNILAAKGLAGMEKRDKYNLLSNLGTISDVLEHDLRNPFAKEQRVREKEGELKHCMSRYYECDMGALKQEIVNMLMEELDKVTQVTEEKDADTAKRLAHLLQLAKDTLDRSSVSGGEGSKADEFRKTENEFETNIKGTRGKKKQLRENIAKTEAYLRRVREQIADLELENKSLDFLIDSTGNLKGEKEQMQIKALNHLNEDLKHQLRLLQAQAREVKSTKIPDSFYQGLDQQHDRSARHLEKMLTAAQEGKKRAENDAKKMQESLKSVKMNKQMATRNGQELDYELEKLVAQYEKYKKELDDLIRSKENQINKARSDTNAEIKKQNIELAQHHAQIRQLKFDILRFKNEFEVLEQTKVTLQDMQKSDKKIDLYMKGLNDAEEKRQQLEKTLNSLNDQWSMQLNFVTQEIERKMRENEKVEFDIRINELFADLQSIEEQIQRVIQTQKETEEENWGICKQTFMAYKKEIDDQLKRYVALIQEKSKLYDELYTSTQRLVELDATYLKNEVEVTKLRMELDIVRRMLDQLMKHIEVLWDKKAEMTSSFQMEISQKVKSIDHLRNKLKERDGEIAQLEEVIRDKDSYIQQLN